MKLAPPWFSGYSYYMLDACPSTKQTWAATNITAFQASDVASKMALLSLCTYVASVGKVSHKPGSVPVVVQTGTTLPLLATIIYLGQALLTGSSDQPRYTSGKGCLSVRKSCISLGLAPDGVYQERSHQRSSGSLTPRFHPCLWRIAPSIGGPFLWHYPSVRTDWTLSSTLPCGARTFLPQPLSYRRLSVKLSANATLHII